MGFGHEKIDVSRASQAIPLNMAEGHGQATHGERSRDVEMARGSALECGAAQDVLQDCGAMPAEDYANAKALLDRIVAKPTTLGQRGDAVHHRSPTCPA